MKRTLVQNPSARAITDRRAALAPILVLTVSLGVWGVGCSAWPGGTRSASTAGVSVGQTNAGGLLGSYLDHQAQELAVIPNAEVEQQDDRLLVTFAGDFLFETGSADLSPGAKNQLGQVAEALKRYPETDVVVKGYTDSAGSESFNLQLSEDRAGSVPGGSDCDGRRESPHHRSRFWRTVSRDSQRNRSRAATKPPGRVGVGSQAGPTRRRDRPLLNEEFLLCARC